MRDPAAYIALLFLLISIQTFVWIIGRHSLELDWWRTAPIAFVLLYALPVTMALSDFFPAIIVCFAISAVLVWALAEFFYEPDLRQRIAMATVLPVLGMIALPLGVFVRRNIFGY